MFSVTIVRFDGTSLFYGSKNVCMRIAHAIVAAQKECKTNEVAAVYVEDCFDLDVGPCYTVKF